jgi:hypothetical protein
MSGISQLAGVMRISNVSRRQRDWIMIGSVIAGLLAGLVATYFGFLSEMPEFQLPGHDPASSERHSRADSLLLAISLVVLKPHETCQDTIEVSYLYDVAKPGEYTVQIERDMPPELGLGVVKSNVVKITVVE